jgi:hypothetical protein
MKQVMPSGVRAASATIEARSPLVTHILVPSMTYSSPSGWALQRRAAVSLPASGSLRESAPLRVPAAMSGRSLAFMSSVPWSLMRVAAIMWVLSTPVRLIQP